MWVLAVGLSAVGLSAVGTGVVGSPVVAGRDARAAALAPAPTSQSTGLDPELERRFEAARAAATAAGVPFKIHSGRRSIDDQQRLVDQAVARYGSEKVAHRFVLPPQASAHVTGLAIDVGPNAGVVWLEKYGVSYGLCQVYQNEPWHFEPLVEPGGDCPAVRPDASWAW